MDDGPPPPDLLTEGVRLFNDGYFFEAHEVWEDLWHRERGESRRFLQGLIQVAAGCHHFRNGNVAGAVALFRKALAKLRDYPDAYLAIDAGGLKARVAALEEAMAGLIAGKPGTAPELPVIRRLDARR